LCQSGATSRIRSWFGAGHFGWGCSRGLHAAWASAPDPAHSARREVRELHRVREPVHRLPMRWRSFDLAAPKRQYGALRAHASLSFTVGVVAVGLPLQLGRIRRGSRGLPGLGGRAVAASCAGSPIARPVRRPGRTRTGLQVGEATALDPWSGVRRPASAVLLLTVFALAFAGEWQGR